MITRTIEITQAENGFAIQAQPPISGGRTRNSVVIEGNDKIRAAAALLEVSGLDLQITEADGVLVIQKDLSNQVDFQSKLG